MFIQYRLMVLIAVKLRLKLRLNIPAEQRWYLPLLDRALFRGFIPLLQRLPLSTLKFLLRLSSAFTVQFF